MKPKLEKTEEVQKEIEKLAVAIGQLEEPPWNLCFGTMLDIHKELGMPVMEA